MVAAAEGRPPFGIEQRGARNWVSIYLDMACSHAHPSSISATRCGRHRRRDVGYDRTVRRSVGPSSLPSNLG
jgi:hypothetical protein